MRNFIGLRLNLLVVIICLGTALTNAQDTARKAATKPAATAPVAAKGDVPINPKTGRPYTKWGYGANAKAYQAQKQADSLSKVNSPDAAAQAPATPVIADKSLNAQYQHLLTKVYNYQQPFVAAFWKNVRDSLGQSRRELSAANEKLAAADQTISQLQSTATQHEEQLAKTDSINFLGVSFSKNGYSIMMWSLVAVLGGLAAVVIMRSGSARSEATYRIKLYNELGEEYKAYKVKANEKEKKLARELQTERNKVDELMGRG